MLIERLLIFNQTERGMIVNKKTYRSQKDFFQLGVDYEQNGFEGLTGDFLRQTMLKNVEFVVKMTAKTREVDLLVYLRELPALFREMPELTVAFLETFESIDSVFYEKDCKNVFSVYVSSWDEFIDDVSRTATDKSRLTRKMNQTKKAYDL